MRPEHRRPNSDSSPEVEAVRASRLTIVNTVIQCAILCAMVYGAYSVERLTARHFQLQRSATYVERLNSEHIVKVRSTFDNWRRSGETLESLMAQSIDPSHGKPSSEKTPEERGESDRALIAAGIEQDLRVFVNFLQELAVAMKYGTLDELYIYDCFGAFVTRYSGEIRSYVDQIRVIRKRPSLYEDIFTMAEKMRELDRKFSKSETPP